MLRTAFAGGLIALVIACSQGSSRQVMMGSWPVFRGDATRSGHATGATLNARDAAHLGLLWRVRLSGPVDASAVATRGRVIIGSQGGELVSLEAATGAVVWRKTGIGGIAASVAVDGEDVFVATLSGEVFNFAFADGRTKWHRVAPGHRTALWSTPTVFRDELLIGVASQEGDNPLEAGAIIGLSRDDGQVRWQLCTLAGCQPGGGVWSTPAIDVTGRAFVGVGNPVDGVLALDAATGKQLWETSFYADDNRDLDIGATPVLFTLGSQEVVGVGSNGGVFKVLDAASGAVVWSRDLVHGSAVHGLISSPAFDGSTLYVASASPPTGIFALTAADGSVRWIYGTDLPIYSAPALGDRVLVFGEGNVFGSTNSGKITALDLSDHRVLWRWDAHSAVRCGPVIAGSIVVVGDFSGDVLAFRPNS